VNFLDQCTQFTAPTKCTVLIICRYHRSRSDMFG